MKPKWTGGLDDNWEEEWRNYGSTPLALAAMQYRSIMKICEQEKNLLKDEQYMEIQFEDFLKAPADTMTQLLSFAQLPASSKIIKYVNNRNYIDTNDKYLSQIPPEHRKILTKIAGQWCYV